MSEFLYRDQLIENVRKSVFGPTPIDEDEEQNEILKINSPNDVYITGVLYPKGVYAKENNDTSDDNTDDSNSEEIIPSIKEEIINNNNKDLEQDDSNNLANQFRPSSAGLTFAVDSLEEIYFELNFGIYEKEEYEDDKKNKRKGFRRIPKKQNYTFSKDGISYPAEREQNIDLKVSTKKVLNKYYVTAFLVNEYIAETNSVDTRKCFFQIQLNIKLSRNSRFVGLEKTSEESLNQESQVLNLLYRKKKRFATGHGCSTNWTNKENKEEIQEINISYLPIHEIEAILPRLQSFDSSKKINLSMEFLSAENSENNLIISNLINLADDYESWIEEQSKIAQTLNQHKNASEITISIAQKFLNRIRSGISILEENEDAINAFKIANRAMLIQQIHDSFVTRNAESINFSDDDDIIDKKCGQYKSDEKKGSWRPFQLAFILINIESIFNDQSSERDIVDLIWFPTGGGKTEAYLGLSAFTILLRRIRDPKNIGCTILMRYTLRLLTSDQFSRLTGLVLALEKIRKEKYLEIDLGDDEISAGLWVGNSLTFNKRQDAVDSKNKGNPPRAGIEKCPSCGTNIEDLDERENNYKTIKIYCGNEKCEWHRSKKQAFPIYSIDEDVYEKCPTIIIGTVDKFAQISWHDLDNSIKNRRILPGNLFGFEKEWDPPELIIQDELHLISSELGSMFGAFEIVIDFLCSKKKKVKVIASTATIKDYQSQCKTLFNRASMAFPVDVLNFGDSYFAYPDNEQTGRKYMGVMTTASSFQSGLRNLVASILQLTIPHNDFENGEFKNNEFATYGTLVWYFNSNRERASAISLVQADIKEEIERIIYRYGINKECRRFLTEPKELYGGQDSWKINSILDNLKTSNWEFKAHNRIDVLLSTSMISVGVDLGKLGLMIVNGQPKVTSEYIQASSRVGRIKPGLVFTVYNSAKSRDRSHYENFKDYHQSMYKYVESSGSTPFTARAREKILPSILISLCKLVCGFEKPDDISNKEDVLNKVLDNFIKRVKEIDPEEYEDFKKDVKKYIDIWKSTMPEKFGEQMKKPKTKTLCYSFGTVPDEENHITDAWGVVSSMRSVDESSALKLEDKIS